MKVLRPLAVAVPSPAVSPPITLAARPSKIALLVAELESLGFLCTQVAQWEKELAQ